MHNRNIKPFPLRLKLARKMNKFTQQYIADELCINRTTYTKWEIGETEPSIDFIKKLAKLLNVDYNFLFSDKDVNATGNHKGCKRFTEQNNSGPDNLSESLLGVSHYKY